MTKFTGYQVEVHRGPEMTERFDYDVEKCRAKFAPGEEWKIPFCPLAAVSLTLRQGTQEEIRQRWHEFQNNLVQIRVFDPSRNETHWYDAASYDFECALETAAG